MAHSRIYSILIVNHELRMSHTVKLYCQNLVMIYKHDFLRSLIHNIHFQYDIPLAAI